MNPFPQLKQTSRSVRSTIATWRARFGQRLHDRQDGQAVMEFSIIVVILAIMVMATVDYGRLFVVRQTMVNASREGANLAVRGTTLSNAVAAMVATSPSLNFSNGYGRIIASTVSRSGSGVVTITGQVKYGGSNYASRIGVLNATGSGVTLPSDQLPQTNQTLYITEVFYPFTPVTPVVKLLQMISTNSVLPSLLYDVTYF